MRSSVVPTELLISVGYPELLHAAATATLVDRIAIRAAIREAAKLLHVDTPANPFNHQREEPALE